MDDAIDRGRWEQQRAREERYRQLNELKANMMRRHDIHNMSGFNGGMGGMPAPQFAIPGGATFPGAISPEAVHLFRQMQPDGSAPIGGGDMTMNQGILGTVGSDSNTRPYYGHTARRKGGWWQKIVVGLVLFFVGKSVWRRRSIIKSKLNCMRTVQRQDVALAIRKGIRGIKYLFRWTLTIVQHLASGFRQLCEKTAPHAKELGKRVLELSLIAYHKGHKTLRTVRVKILEKWQGESWKGQ